MASKPARRDREAHGPISQAPDPLSHAGFLWPQTASCLVAVTPANRENGCLQVLKGSHLAGRIEHGDTGDQTGADLQRVSELEKELELVYCELNPGDAVFFDGRAIRCIGRMRTAASTLGGL